MLLRLLLKCGETVTCAVSGQVLTTFDINTVERGMIHTNLGNNYCCFSSIFPPSQFKYSPAEHKGSNLWKFCYTSKTVKRKFRLVSNIFISHLFQHINVHITKVTFCFHIPAIPYYKSYQSLLSIHASKPRYVTVDLTEALLWQKCW